MTTPRSATGRLAGACTLDPASVERAVLDIVGEIVGAIHGGQLPPAVSVDSHLEWDLGIYSLERVELALRLEEAFGVPLRNGSMADAECVGDVVAAIGGRIPLRPARIVAASRPAAKLDGGPLPRSLAFSARVGILLALMAPPVWVLLALCRDARRASAILRRSARALLWAARCPLDVRGLEHLQEVRGVVLACNHESFIDSVVLVAALPLHFTIVVNERLPDAPMIGMAIRRAGYLVVNRTTVATRLAGTAAMVDALHRGESLLVFPEGTTSRGAGLLPFRLGAFAAAVEAERPIVPVALSGTGRILPRGTWVLARAGVRVVIQAPVHPAGSGWTETVRLRDTVRTRIGDVPR